LRLQFTTLGGFDLFCLIWVVVSLKSLSDICGGGYRHFNRTVALSMARSFKSYLIKTTGHFYAF